MPAAVRAIRCLAPRKIDLVKKEALARCGGPSDCILLYVGQQKQGNFEIVTQ